MGTKPTLKNVHTKDYLQWKMTSKVKYLSNHRLDLPQILNLNILVQTKNEELLITKMTSNGRRPLMEDDLKILKVEYPGNH